LLPGRFNTSDAVFDDAMTDGDDDCGDAFLSSVQYGSFPPNPLDQSAFSSFSLQDSVIGRDGKGRLAGRNLSQRTKSTVQLVDFSYLPTENIDNLGEQEPFIEPESC
jgi:hypothetical protein